MGEVHGSVLVWRGRSAGGENVGRRRGGDRGQGGRVGRRGTGERLRDVALAQEVERGTQAGQQAGGRLLGGGDAGGQRPLDVDLGDEQGSLPVLGQWLRGDFL